MPESSAATAAVPVMTRVLSVTAGEEGSLRQLVFGDDECAPARAFHDQAFVS
jgi:hypothetical protein